MSKELKDLIEQNKGRTISDTEFDIQVRSCAFGDLAIEDKRITRAGIDRAVDRLKYGMDIPTQYT